MSNLVETGIEQAVRLAGSQSALARALGVTQACVWGWQRRGWVPVERAAAIEAEYGVPARQLVEPRVVQLLDCWAATHDLV
jgi:DNA-binding transcriptional regulator YdaS (Cro superfamily)